MSGSSNFITIMGSSPRNYMVSLALAQSMQSRYTYTHHRTPPVYVEYFVMHAIDLFESLNKHVKRIMFWGVLNCLGAFEEIHLSDIQSFRTSLSPFLVREWWEKQYRMPLSKKLFTHLLNKSKFSAFTILI